jgi:hypothetical protein
VGSIWCPSPPYFLINLDVLFSMKRFLPLASIQPGESRPHLSGLAMRVADGAVTLSD